MNKQLNHGKMWLHSPHCSLDALLSGDRLSWMPSTKRFWVHLQHFARPVSIACFFALFAVSCRQSPKLETVTISNTEPRRDVNGHIVDAHGGCLQFFNGRFYLNGSAFGTNQSYAAWNCPFAVYSSPNLKDW